MIPRVSCGERLRASTSTVSLFTFSFQNFIICTTSPVIDMPLAANIPVMTEGFDKYFTVRMHAPRNTIRTIPTQMNRYTWSFSLIALRSPLRASLLARAADAAPSMASPKCGPDPA